MYAAELKGNFRFSYKGHGFWGVDVAARSFDQFIVSIL